VDIMLVEKGRNDDLQVQLAYCRINYWFCYKS